MNRSACVLAFLCLFCQSISNTARAYDEFELQYGTGVPDIHPKLSKMVERISTGVDSEAAFAQEFGKPFTALLESFKKYLDDTKNSPARLKGMMWQSLPSEMQQPPASDDEDES